MPGAGVVHADPGCAFQAGAQDRLALATKSSWPWFKSRRSGAWRYRRRDHAIVSSTFHAGLGPVVLGQHEAAKLGAEMTPRPRRQGRHHISHPPGSASCSGATEHCTPADQILNQIILVALEARTRRCLGRDHAPLIDRNPPFLARRRALLAARPALPRDRASPSMPLGLISGGPERPLRRRISSRNTAFSARKAA